LLRVCAWCGKEMGRKPGPENEITHGACPECVKYFLLSDPAPSLPDFLQSLGMPVLLVDGDVRVRAGNPLAASLVGKDLDALEGTYGGQVVECARARLPGGCGKTVHCRACAIRNTVTDTFRTGRSHSRVPALADQLTADGERVVRFHVSTEKVGAAVLLRIDDVAPGEGEPEVDGEIP